RQLDPSGHALHEPKPGRGAYESFRTKRRPSFECVPDVRFAYSGLESDLFAYIIVVRVRRVVAHCLDGAKVARYPVRRRSRLRMRALPELLERLQKIVRKPAAHASAGKLDEVAFGRCKQRFVDAELAEFVGDDGGANAGMLALFEKSPDERGLAAAEEAGDDE